MNIRPVFFFVAILLAMPRACLAELYLLHGKGDSVIGSIRHTAATHEDTLLDVARKYGLGYMDIKLGNPGLDTWLPGENADVTLPTEFVLPAVPHEGIVLNIPEMRLYYFPPGRRNDVREVITYPLGIGREGWSTPYVDTRVIDKQQHPYWYPPKSIRLEHAQEGEPLPARVGPGPENPLGDYALRLGLPSYLIHGTNKPWGVGMRVSHGCIRLYPEDIAELFKLVGKGTRVHIVNQPYKVGIREDQIYLEAHPYLDEDRDRFADNLTSVVKMLIDITGDRPYDVDWRLARRVVKERNGIPVVIGTLRVAAAGTLVEAPAPAEPEEGVNLRLETRLGTQ